MGAIDIGVRFGKHSAESGRSRAEEARLDIYNAACWPQATTVGGNLATFIGSGRVAISVISVFDGITAATAFQHPGRLSETVAPQFELSGANVPWTGSVSRTGR